MSRKCGISRNCGMNRKCGMSRERGISGGDDAGMTVPDPRTNSDPVEAYPVPFLKINGCILRWIPVDRTHRHWLELTPSVRQMIILLLRINGTYLRGGTVGNIHCHRLKLVLAAPKAATWLFKFTVWSAGGCRFTCSA